MITLTYTDGVTLEKFIFSNLAEAFDYVLLVTEADTLTQAQQTAFAYGLTFKISIN